MMKNSIVKFRWHILVVSGYIIIAILLLKRVYHLPLISEVFILGVVFWLIGWVIIFTKTKIATLFENSWISWKMMKWIMMEYTMGEWRMRGWRMKEQELILISADKEKELRFSSRLFTGCFFIIISLILIICDLFEFLTM